jgi:hypothetical protein
VAGVYARQKKISAGQELFDAIAILTARSRLGHGDEKFGGSRDPGRKVPQRIGCSMN